jgi:hypothetical protein
VVKSVTGEVISTADLGGAAVHSSVSGVAHFVYPDDFSCLNGVRQLLGYLPQNNGEKAGQTVFHFHIHLIPRYADGPRIVADWVQNPLSDETREEVITKASVKEF